MGMNITAHAQLWRCRGSARPISCQSSRRPWEPLQTSETGRWLRTEEHIVRDVSSRVACDGNLEASAMSSDEESDFKSRLPASPNVLFRSSIGSDSRALRVCPQKGVRVLTGAGRPPVRARRLRPSDDALGPLAHAEVGEQDTKSVDAIAEARCLIANKHQ